MLTDSQTRLRVKLESLPRQGFTLIELLVSFVIVGMLLSLTVMGVGVAREASRRTECTSRMRQLVLATHQFESSHRKLPSAVTYPDYGNGAHHSSGYWRLLPYFGFETLAIQVRDQDFGKSTLPTGQQGFRPREARVSLPFLLCPSDSVDEGTNYRFNTGSHPIAYTYPGSSPSQRANGPFGGSHVVVRFSNVVGGTTGCVAFSERMKSQGRGYHHRADIWTSGLSAEFDQIDHDLLYSLGAELGTAAPVSFFAMAGRTWHGGGKSFTMYDHVFTPNAAMPAITTVSSSGTYFPFEAKGAVPPTSRHRGGVNAAMLDGSVRFVIDEIDRGVWHRLGSISELP